MKTAQVWLIAKWGTIEEYALVPPGQTFVDTPDPVVWWDVEAHVARCTRDSGPIAAMSASCSHSRRIRRLGLAGKLPTTLVDKNTGKPLAK